MYRCNALMKTVKPVLRGHSKRRSKLVFKTDYRLMQVQGEPSAILSSFIKLPFVIKIFVLSIFEWPLKTGFTVTRETEHYTGTMFNALRCMF